MVEFTLTLEQMSDLEPVCGNKFFRLLLSSLGRTGGLCAFCPGHKGSPADARKSA